MDSVDQLTPLVRRIIAPNPGPMTGSGTNTYLVGQEQIAVIDPGPPIERHVDAVLDACDGRLHSVLVTHTHGDHSPAAAKIAARYSTTLVGATPPDDSFQDTSFVPDIELVDGSVIETEEWRIRAIHTPGHVGNHFCFLIDADGMLMAGDHLMNGSTVVIIPPSGDMAAYIGSLRRLLDYPIQSIAPGHGEVMDKPREVIEWTIAHRLERERKVVEKLAMIGRATLSELVAHVYDDVDSALHKLAEKSLWAHLLKLRDEGHVASEGAYWTLMSSL